jgi:YVTN family beta-propeller protein
VFVADDLGAWLVGLLAEAGRKRLTSVVLGSDQDRALRRAATAAVQLTVRELRPEGGERAEELAMVITQVFGEPTPTTSMSGQATLLEGLQTAIAAQLSSLDDPSLTGTKKSAADVLGIPATVLAQNLTGHLIREIVVRGARGGPLAPLAAQLNHDVTHLQGQRIEHILGRLDNDVQEALGQLGSGHAAPAASATPPVRETGQHEATLAGPHTEPAEVTRASAPGTGAGITPIDTRHRGRVWLLRAGAATTVAIAAAAIFAIYYNSLPSTSRPGSSTATPGTPISVGSRPDWIVIAKDGKTAYVTNNGDGTVTPINLATATPGQPIRVGNQPLRIAITPDGKTAYVTNNGDGTVTPINLATATPGQPIRVGNQPFGIAITPDGKTAYVANQADGTVTPINLATKTPGTPITVGNAPQTIVISKDGRTAYVANQSTDTVTPISLPADVPETPIKVAYYPDGITISPDGKTAYATDNGLETITPINLAARQASPLIAVNSPIAIAITSDGRTAYIANYAVGTVTPMSLPADILQTPIKVGHNPDSIAITPDGKTAYVTNNGDSTVTPISLPTGGPS